MPTVDDYLLEAWRRGAPNHLPYDLFPRGFWQDVARAAVELALAGDLSAPLSFRQTRSGPDAGLWPSSKIVKGIDVAKLEFKI